MARFNVIVVTSNFRSQGALTCLKVSRQHRGFWGEVEASQSASPLSLMLKLGDPLIFLAIKSLSIILLRLLKKTDTTIPKYSLT